MGDYLKYPKDRKKYPTEEVDPEHFISNDNVRKMIENIDSLNFKQEDYLKIFNCVDCGLCKTEMERIQLKSKFLEQGFSIEGLKEMNENFKKYKTPYPTDKMRVKFPKGIKNNSDTLFFMGCLSTIRIPRYTEHALDYLLSHNVEFTVLDKEICCGWPWFASGLHEEFEICKQENIPIFEKYEKVICLCPACFFLFNKYYKSEMKSNTEFVYISDYLKPSNDKKKGKIAIQHLCQLINRGFEGIEEKVELVLKESGYEIADIPHWCCGGGIGYMHRTDIIDKIAKKRMQDFDKEDVDYATTYCVSCWWILKWFSKKCKIKPIAKDIFELLL
ncbi:MAG: heterodisulfide reductase-related iron-sulfur binding cluster [Promethearchaeota archaeon]